MKISTAQIQCTNDIEANKLQAIKLIEKAASEGADLIAFPEMSILEFFPRKPHQYDFFKLAEPLQGETYEWFASLARKHNIHIMYNHYELSPEHLFFDCSVVIDRTGEFVGKQRMMHIAEEPGYNEKFYYTPGWDTYNVFELEGWRFGIAICYDRHFPEVFRSFILQGAELVIIPVAVAGTDPYSKTYELEMRAAAVTHGVYIAMVNRSGKEDDLDFIGRSMIIDPTGNVVDSLDNKPNQVLTREIFKEVVTRARTYYPFLRDRRPETYDIL